jgi:hypothetical protein
MLVRAYGAPGHVGERTQAALRQVPLATLVFDASGRVWDARRWGSVMVSLFICPPQGALQSCA